MVDVQVFVVCADCRVHWNADDEPRCTNAEHTHQRMEIHRHRSVVELPDGTSVIGVSFDASDPYTRGNPPDYGLYLDYRWQPPWPHDHLDWPDFGVPADPAPVAAALRTVLDRARAGQNVEVGCLGGHGRTGTALACLAILAGHRAEDAVDWVRAEYCSHAVETPGQEAFVAQFRG